MLQSSIEVTPGRKGATRAAYDPENPMPMVRGLWIKNKTADTDEMQRLVRREVGISATHPARPLVDYATANLVERLRASEKDEPTPRPKPVDTAAKKDARKARVIADQAEQAVLAAVLVNGVKDGWYLEQVAPNGKAIGNCTGLECSQFTGYFKAIGNGVGSDQKVRDVKSGTDVKNAQTWAD